MIRWTLFCITAAMTFFTASWGLEAFSPLVEADLKPGFFAVLLLAWLPWFAATILAFRCHHLEQLVLLGESA